MLGGIHFFVASSFSPQLTKIPMVAILIGIISHHLLDRLPHLDTNIFGEKDVLFKKKDLRAWALVVGEFLFFLILAFYFLGKYSLDFQKIAFWGGIGGILPDIIRMIFDGLSLPKPKFIHKYINFHNRFHFQLKRNWYTIIICLLVELIIFLICLKFLI